MLKKMAITMNILLKSTTLRVILIMLLTGTLTGCLYWMRAFQTYLQLSEFDKNFVINDHDTFEVHFNAPILYHEDFVKLSKLEPTSKKVSQKTERWRYLFRKVDKHKKPVSPELSFFFDLEFNQQKRIATWVFSPLFLEIAPPKFLEASLRSLAGGKIDKEKRQLKANSHIKITAKLPQKKTVIARLGKPIKIDNEVEQDVYYYHFLLETPMIEKGYEERALSIVKLTFSQNTHELTQMAGRFAGLKIAIKYQRYLNQK
jgi:outer membrane protein assembly factor BamE (lipoprotein component of BamABCDE complex)